MMKRIFCLMLCVAMLASLLAVPAAAATNSFEKTDNIAQNMINAALAQKGKKNADFSGMPRDHWCAYFIIWLSKNTGAGDAGILPKKYSGFGTVGKLADGALDLGKSTMTMMNQKTYDFMVERYGAAHKSLGSHKTYTPKPGDLVFFLWKGSTAKISHVALVYKVTDSKIYYVDGNGSAEAGSSAYYKRSYVDTHSMKRSDSQIVAYLRPDYGNTANPPADTSGLSVENTINCLYYITVPANYKLQGYETPTSTKKYRMIAAQSSSYKLTCTQKLDMSDGSTRYFFVDGQGYGIYFIYNSKMSVTVLHDYSSSWVEPTCTEDGYWYYSCTCGYSYENNYSYAQGHRWDEGQIIREATETAEGEMQYTCTVCQEIKTEVIPVKEHTHAYQATVTAPTCTGEGYTTHTCACGHSYQDTETKATGHAWDEGKVTKEPTETAEGEKTFTCKTCNETRKEVIAKLNHTHKYTDTVVKPTCTEEGYTTHACACGHSYQDTETKATGHVWDEGKVTKEPTETAEGEKTFTCTACGETRVEMLPVKEHVHSHQARVTAPTCTEEGYTTYTCACGDCYTDAYTSALGHSYANGKCTVCGFAAPPAETDVVASGRAENMTWSLDKNGKLTISGQGDMPYCTMEAEVPWYAYAEQIKSVVMEEGITSVGPYAFRKCLYLEEVTIPQGVTVINKYAFDGCVNLKAVSIPGTVETIGLCAFNMCERMETLELGDGVREIQNHAFDMCRALTEVTIPASITKLENMAFASCDNLGTLHFKGDMPQFVGNVFSGSGYLSDIICYYPANNDTWVNMGSYGASLKWVMEGGCLHSQITNANAKAATCTESGYTGERVCALCGEILSSGSETPALGHSYENGSCTTCGEKDPGWQEPKPVTSTARLAGTHRFNTAFLAANQMKLTLGIEKFDTVVVASGMDFADALSGSYLAAVNHAPILLACNVEKYNNEVKAYILENLNQGGTVYILGGENAVPDSFKTGLEGFRVERLAGKHRFDTNLKVLEKAGVESETILVATGLDFADCLSASAAGLPILLVYGDKLTADQAAFLAANRDKNLCILGGEGAVSVNLEVQLAGYGTVERLAGKTRFDTSVLIAEKFFKNPESAVLAYARDFPDGLCGGSLAAALNAPLILTMEKYEQKAAAYIQDNSMKTGLILGGEKLIPDATIDILFHAK